MGLGHRPAQGITVGVPNKGRTLEGTKEEQKREHGYVTEKKKWIKIANAVFHGAGKLKREYHNAKCVDAR